MSAAQDARPVAPQDDSFSMRHAILSRTLKAIGKVKPVFSKKKTADMNLVRGSSSLNFDVGGDECKDQDPPDVHTELETEDPGRCHDQAAGEGLATHRELDHPTNELVQDIRIEHQKRRKTESRRQGVVESRNNPEKSAVNTMMGSDDECSRRSSPSSESRLIASRLNTGPGTNSDSEDLDGALSSMNPDKSLRTPSSRRTISQTSTRRKQHDVSKSRRSGQQDPPAALCRLMELRRGLAATDHSAYYDPGKVENKGRRSSKNPKEIVRKSEEDNERNSKSSTSTHLESFSMARIGKLIFEVSGMPSAESDRTLNSEIVRLGSSHSVDESDGGSGTSMDLPDIASEMKTTLGGGIRRPAQKSEDGANRVLERKRSPAKPAGASAQSLRTTHPVQGSRRMIFDSANSQSSNNRQRSRRAPRAKMDPPGIVLGAFDEDDEALTANNKNTEGRAPLCPNGESCSQVSLAPSEMGDSDFSTTSIVTLSSTERSLTGFRPQECGTRNPDDDLLSQRGHDPNRSRHSSCRNTYDSRGRRLQGRNGNSGIYKHPSLQRNRRTHGSSAKEIPVTNPDTDTAETPVGSIIGTNVVYT